MKDSLKQRLEAGSQSVLTLAGVYGSPHKGASPAGVSRLGANVYTLDTLANSTNLKAGMAVLHSFAAMVTPFNVLSKKEKERIAKIEKTSADPRLIEALNKEHMMRNGERFVATILKAVDSSGRHGLGVLAGVKLYDHWGVMSPAQKSIGIAVLAIQTYKTDKGGTVCDLKIIDGKDQTFLVRDALNLFVQNKNPYPLVKYWNQIFDLFKVYGNKPTPELMADFATSHGLIGLSITGSAVPGVNKQAIEASGGKSAPQYGVGALAIPNGKNPPNGYIKTAQTPGGTLISPQANIKSAQGAISGSLLGSKAGQDGLSSDSVGVYAKWKKDDKKKADEGAEGGSALIAGLTNLKRSTPVLYNALIALLTKHTKDKIQDSSPTQYLACLAGIVLGRLVTGAKSEQADKDGVALARQVHDKTPAEFAKIQINIRALYANFGISSKADAYQLSNQGYAEGRFDESDLVGMHEIFDIIYDDDGLTKAQRLMNGKDKGLEIAQDKTPPAKNTMTDGQATDHKEVLAQLTKDELRKRNAAKYAKKATGPNPPEHGETPGESESPSEQKSPTEPSQEAPQAEQQTTPNQMGSTP